MLICILSTVRFSSVAQLCPTLCDPMNHSMPGLPVHHQLLESTQTHVHWVNDAIQRSHPLLSSSPPALNLSQHQGLFKWVSSLHQMAKVLAFQLQHLSYQYFQQEWLFLIKNPKSGNIRTKLCVFFFLDEILILAFFSSWFPAWTFEVRGE